jgi:hypothetical protein
MNVRIKFNATFTAGIWYKNSLQMNNYSAEIYFITNTSSNSDHEIGMERVQHFIYKELESTVFINEDDHDQIQALLSAGIKITTLPEDPFDQIVGIVLYSKLNAILENNMTVNAVNIESILGDSIQYLHNNSEIDPVIATPGWWTDTSPRHSDIKQELGKKKVVKLKRSSNWKDLGLSWHQNANDESNENVLILAFDKDDK